MTAPRHILIAIGQAVERQTIAVHHASLQDAMDDARELVRCWEDFHREHSEQQPAPDTPSPRSREQHEAQQ
jgi:hypothetical protein